MPSEIHCESLPLLLPKSSSSHPGMLFRNTYERTPSRNQDPLLDLPHLSLSLRKSKPLEGCEYSPSLTRKKHCRLKKRSSVLLTGLSSKRSNIALIPANPVPDPSGVLFRPPKKVTRFALTLFRHPINR